MTIEETQKHTPVKGSLCFAQPVWSPTKEYGVETIWAVRLSFQSPTGDSSDTISREIPCLTEAQAVSIANYWNSRAEVGAF